MKKKILYVYAPAGPPLDYFFPMMAVRADIFTCLVSPPSEYNRPLIEKYSKNVDNFCDLPLENALKQIRKKAHEIKPDVIFTFSEFLLISVSQLAQEFGLINVGKNIQHGRNKIIMREKWQAASLNQPKFVAIRQQHDVERVKSLKVPFLIKLAMGAGSIGQQIVYDHAEIDVCIKRLLQVKNAAVLAGKHEFTERDCFPQLIAEEIIQSSTDSWYKIPGYGDYLSVEGLVREGVYYPLAITGRLPTIPPFTELCNLAPCVLDDIQKQKIVEIVTTAINALALENCATHTEIKLMRNGEIALLETAARMGGVVIAREIAEVFGINYVDLFLSVLLNEECEIPAFESIKPRCAAASVALIACDSQGNPWKTKRKFDPDAVDWGKLVGGNASVQIQLSQSIAKGLMFPPYDLAGGILNYAGQAFLTSPDPASLKTAAYNLLNGLENYLPQA